MSGRSGDGAGGEAARPRAHRVAVLLSIAASAAFLSAAVLRRLNFDEPLALRAGFLSLSGIPAEPGFAMPFTILLGALARMVADPGLLFVLARLLVAGAVLATLAAAFRDAGRTAGLVPAALVATLANGAFFVHGLEFRYDAAILVLLVAALPALVRGSDRALLALGVLAGLLATHHLKGVFFAAALLGFAAFRGGLRGIPRLAVGFAASVAAWLLVARATGVLGDVVGLYASYSDVAVATERPGAWSTLRETLLRDGAWWVLAAAALLASLAALAGLSREELRRSPDLWALALAGASMAFLSFHPHPFPYMLALPAPFVGFLAARRIVGARPRDLAAAALAAALLLGAQGALRLGPFAAHAASFRAPMAPQVEALRWLKARSSPADRVLDPSGLAWFLPPCTPQWYLDTLFEPRARFGGWMADLPRTDLAGCPWMVLTYRLEMLPPGVRLGLPAVYAPVHPGIALHRRDGRWGTPGFERPVVPEGLDSFW